MPLALPQSYHNSKTKAAGLLLLSLLFVSGGALIVWKGDTEDHWIGGLLMAFFIVGVVVFARQFLDQAPRLTLTATGMTDRSLKLGEIPWRDIEGAYLRSVYLRSVRGSEFICLQLRNTDDYLARLSPMMRRLLGTNTALGFTPISLNLTGLKADTNEILAIVLAQSGR
ncbi:STM3941 family protein [Hymenobacter psoromatis]|uniref:STM3941 family protein n=1 Tax=Hymenobacter psoromatis TaxID=1484116 RepID=UPI001CBBFFE0|nr:STM3941 family protein [Hymenobacter psoromatis]